ncbi:MAG: NPCBM/NEW2 domain-containing protein [Planctomycetota bacterium]|nr:NPCBM/NEW2 domain-containing protein [Planctomycetota bacterium]
MTAASCLLLAAAAATADQIETVDAQVASGQVVRIASDGAVLRADGHDRTVAPGEVMRISLAPGDELMNQSVRTVVVTAPGDELSAENLTVADGKAAFTAPGLGALTLDLSAVRTIYLGGGAMTPDAAAGKFVDLKAAQGDRDVLLVARDKDVFTIAGTFKGLDEKNVLFNWNDSDKKVDRSKVLAIRLASLRGAAAAPAGVVHLTGGVKLAFTALTVDESSATVATVTAGARKFARTDVAGVRFRGEGVVDLSSLKPAAAREYGFFDHVFPYRLNRSAGGGTIQLGGKAYSTGLGLHSFCELTYDLGGSYSRLVALAGIDQAARPNGDAVLTLLADGKPILGPTRLTGKDEPVLVRLDVKGCKTLIIRVEFGPDNLDVGDHVDLAAARLIK